jgi:cation diffusion facilitator family transporter
MWITLIGVLVSILLALIKVVTGVVGHSYALIADGIESAIDILSALVVGGGLWIASLPPDENHPYGHGKAESLAAMTVALALMVAAVGIAIQSIREILTPHHVPAPFTLLVLLGVICTKEVLFRIMSRIGESVTSTALQVDAWHHRSDALTSAAAFIGISIALLAGEGYESADDWAALLACGVIGWNGIRLMRFAVSEVMDTAPSSEIEAQIRTTAKAVQEVQAVEKCRVRKSGLGWLVDIHIMVDGDISVDRGHTIAHSVKNALCSSHLGVFDVLVHIEPLPSGEQST